MKHDCMTVKTTITGVCVASEVFWKIEVSFKLVFDFQLNNLLVSTMCDIQQVMVDWMCRCQSGCSVEGNDTCEGHVEDVWCWASVVQSVLPVLSIKSWTVEIISWLVTTNRTSPLVLSLLFIMESSHTGNHQLNQPSDYMYFSVTHCWSWSWNHLVYIPLFIPVYTLWSIKFWEDKHINHMVTIISRAEVKRILSQLYGQHLNWPPSWNRPSIVQTVLMKREKKIWSWLTDIDQCRAACLFCID